MSTHYQGTGYPNGFNPNTKKPIDVRLVVDSVADRNSLEFTYPSMPVSVLGAPLVVNGVTTYPAMSHWRCLVDKNPTFGGLTTSAADWVRDDAPSSLTSGSYRGAWDAAANAPNLTDAALRASLKSGDYYRVQTPGATPVDGLSNWAVNDSAFWDGTRFQRFENTNPNAIAPLYRFDEGARFVADVLDLIRVNALTEYAAGQAYRLNTYVKHTYADAATGKTYVDTYVATADLSAAAAGLPTVLTPNSGWLLVTTTNGAQLGGAASQDDTLGTPATGSYTPTTRTAGKYLSIEESDARLRQYGGKQSGPLLGGDAATFLTADLAEVPRN